MGWQDDAIVAPVQQAAPASQPKMPWETDPIATMTGPGLTMADVGNAAQTGLNWLGTQWTKAGTGIMGTARSVGESNQALAESLGQKLGIPETGAAIGSVLKYATPIPLAANLPSSASYNKIIFSPTSQGGLGVPEVNAADNPNLTIKPPILGGGSINLGKILDAGAQAIPTMLLGPQAVGGALRQGLTTAIPGFVSGVGGEAAGQAAEGVGAPAWAQTGARILGSGAGYALGNRAISPLPSALAPEEARSVATAKEIGAPMSVFQETGRGKGLDLGVSRSFGAGGQYEALRDKQALALQGKALEDIGVTGGLNRTDPTTMAEVFAQKNAEFNAAKNTTNPVTLDNQFYKDLAGHVQKYVDNTNPSTRIPSVAKRAQDFLDKAATATSENGPTVSGPEYQALRSNVGEASYQAANPQAKYALKGIRNALDDAMARSVSPDEAAAFQQARANWAGLKTISKAAVGGTVGARSEGNISPSALATALKASQGTDVYARTTGGLNDLARMSAYLADKVPSSGTGETMNAQEAIRSFLPGAGAGATTGAAGGAFLGGPTGALIGGLAGAAAPGLKVLSNNLLARALTGGTGMGWLRNYLVNQNAQNLDPRLIGALVGGSQAAGQGGGR